MEAPEKIYLPTVLSANAVAYKQDNEIEYIRKDVVDNDMIGPAADHAFCDGCDFMREKAFKWLEENANKYVDIKKLLKDFHKAMTK